MSLDIARIQALCFDVDGTLSDTDDLFVQKLSRLLTPFKVFFPNKDPHSIARKIVMTTETPGNFLYGIPDRLGIDDEIAAIGDFLYRKGLGRKINPFLLIPKTIETVQTLYGHFPLAVISARGKRSTEYFLNQFSLSKYFHPVITAQTCQHTKPYPDPLIFAAAQFGVKPEACLMIGDTSVDIIAAKRANAQAVGVLSGFGEEKELRNAGADIVLDSIANLPAVLLGKK